MGRIAALCAGLVTVFALAGSAAAEVYKGGTSQKSKHATLKTSAEGKPTKFFIKWRADCDFTNNIQGRSSYIKLQKANKQRFSVRLKNKQRFDDYFIKFKGRARGERRNAHAYGGTFKLKALFITNDGRKFGACKTGVVRWFAHD